jgi:hypothetical protein
MASLHGALNRIITFGIIPTKKSHLAMTLFWYLLNILGMRAHRPEGFLEKLVVPLKPHRTARGACVGTFPLFFEKIPFLLEKIYLYVNFNSPAGLFPQ